MRFPLLSASFVFPSFFFTYRATSMVFVSETNFWFLLLTFPVVALLQRMIVVMTDSAPFLVLELYHLC